MEEFVLVIARSDKEALAQIRCISGIKAAEDENQVWLRGIDSKTIEDKKLRQLPVKQSFSLDATGNLFLIGGLTPVDRLIEMQWQPLNTFITVELPASAHPGIPAAPVMIKLVPSANVQKGVALLTNLVSWKNYADTAPASRLKPLRFAVSEKAEVLIIGDPLPPIPGSEYWLNHQMLLPCGYDFELPLAAQLMQREMTSNNNSIIVFDKENNWYEVDKNFFVPAKRSAVRLTKTINSIAEQ